MYDLRNLRAGDKLVRKKLLADHTAIYLGDGKVLHNAPDKGEHLSSFEEFAQGKDVKYYSPDESKRSYILGNAYKILNNPGSYNFFTNNCEHTVTKVTKGKAYSEQLAAFGFMCVSIAVLVIIAKSVKN